MTMTSERTDRKVFRLGAFLVSLLVLSPPLLAVCPQPPESAQGKVRKGLARRLFIKTLRHEVSIEGGVYASDLLGSSLAAGLSYAFHLNESFALEIAYLYTYLTSSFNQPVRDFTGTDVLRPLATNVYTGSLVWYPFHGKLMVFRSAVPHFDLFLAAGAGVTDNQSSQGLTYSVAGGMKLFLTSWLSLRVQLRDLIYVQRLLGAESLTNNLVFTLGAGFWFPP